MRAALEKAQRVDTWPKRGDFRVCP